MKICDKLPPGYREIQHIDLQKDRKTAVRLNLAAGTVMIVLLVLGHFIVPITAFGSIADPAGRYFLKLTVLLFGYLLYMVLHELTHAAVMKALGGRKVVFGFTGLYAYAGSREDFFDKAAYRAVALAPLLFWGLFFLVLLLNVPRSWFWVVWILQAGNIAGAAGDVYVTVKLRKMPASVLIRDTGVEMAVFDRAASEAGTTASGREEREG